MNKVLLVSSVFFLAACNAPSTPQNAERQIVGEEKAETLLDTEKGVWAVEEDKKPRDPREAHLWARQQVDPTELTTEHSYTSKMSPQEMEEEQYRVMRLKPGTVQVAESQLREKVESAVEHEPIALASALPIPKTKPVPPQKSNSEVPLPEEKPAFKPVRGLNAEAITTLKAPEPANNTDKDWAFSEASEAPRTASNRVDEVKPQDQKPASGDENRIVNVRVGDHPGKTRIVFDSEKPVKFSAAMQADGQSLRVTFDGAIWDTSAEKSFSSHALLSSYQTEQNGGRAVVNLSLKRPGSVTMQQTYPPNETYKNYRIVIDISAS